MGMLKVMRNEGDAMIYQANNGQVFYGHTIGILMLDTFVPMIPGDVGNATSFSYPILYRTLHKITANKMMSKEPEVLQEILLRGKELVRDGAKTITGDCGFFLYYQKELRRALNVPVFLSSLIQLPFILHLLSRDEKVGIITADSTMLTDALLYESGVTDMNRIKIKGLENTDHFYQACIAETGTLDSMLIEQEVVAVTKDLVQRDKGIKAILLECSFLPPYAKAIQKVSQLPVFDYKTMIDYVHSTFVKPRYQGYL
ncbi:aspartate/glutamate racemase family protein [Halalkalibacter urbisdiaboli]|uniref:aspartate/glutamate racemase family protein n=1 Tax=Halalkalibacter urbisdiaboli TaxID=1960589 RepID=UPI001FD8D7A4|nr:aspartate/glutamate racemase family protein [Halalkalibacter urbisdiaboli]